MTFRSFLDRIFQGGEGQIPSPPSGDWSEKRKANRVSVQWPDRLEVSFLIPEGQEKGSTLVADILNVSLKGVLVEFKTVEEAQKASPGMKLTASLAIDDFSIPLQVEVVRRVTDKKTAIGFKPPFPKELDRLQQFLEPRCLGISLREIKSANLKKEEGRTLRWFQGVNDTNLFSWADSSSGEIIQQQLVFLDSVLEWVKDRGLKTGQIISTPAAPGGWVRSELLEFTPELDGGIVEKARALLNFSNIPKEVKDALLQKILNEKGNA